MSIRPASGVAQVWPGSFSPPQRGPGNPVIRPTDPHPPRGYGEIMQERCVGSHIRCEGTGCSCPCHPRSVREPEPPKVKPAPQPRPPVLNKMVKQKPPRRKPGFCKYGHEIAVVGVFSNRTCLGCRPQLASSQDEIKARHQAGESITALAREYDLDRRTIYKFVGKGEKRGGGEPRKVVFPVFMERAVGRLADKADVKLKLTNGRDALFEELLAVVKQHAGLAEKTDA